MTGMDATTGKALTGIAHLRQSVRDILTTPRGSRVMRRDYGSDLFSLVDAPMTPATRIDIIAAAADAIRRHEPRLRVSSVAVAVSAGEVELTISGTYLPNGDTVTLEGLAL